MGSAFYATGRQVGGALGVAVSSAIIGAVVAPSDGYRWTMAYVAFIMIAAATAMAVLFRRPSPTELAAAEVVLTS